MDFGSLLHVAQKNDKHPKKEIKYYSTKFEPPKKEERSSKQLSANIKKFLARKEQEEKKKATEAKLKREELLALRSQDKKATRRVSVMLKRTKSANKSVIQDAIDNDNTAVTLTGPSQPDEDDYGYVSQEASAFYNKMVAKYSNMPDEPKFPSAKKNTNVNLSGTKNRVRAALLKEQEEALLPHKRKRKHKTEDSEHSESEPFDTKEPIEEKKTTMVKPKPAPPPMNFHELLKIAEKKQFEPIVIQQKKKPEDDGHPMTKKQKREYEKEKAWLEHREKRLLSNENGEKRLQSNENGEKSVRNSEKSLMPPPNKIPKLNNNIKIPKNSNSNDHNLKVNSQKSSLQNIPKKNNALSVERKSDPGRSSKLRTELENGKSVRPQSSPQINNRALEIQSSKSNNKNDIISNMKNVPKKELNKSAIKAMPNGASKTSDIRNSTSINKQKHDLESKIGSNDVRLKQNIPSNAKIKQPSLSDTKLKKPPNGMKHKQLPSSDIKAKQFSPGDIKLKQFPPLDLKRKQFPPADLKPKQFPPADLKPKQFPPADLKPKQFPPKDLKPKQFPPGDIRRTKDIKKKPPMGHKRRILDDDDSEYDSEMDDFIDDGPQDGEDYSRYISEIFGYDKSRYRDVDEDDAEMESSFSQMMKEEYISSKIGIMEDLEDMRQEALDKKRKAMKKNMK